MWLPVLAAAPEVLPWETPEAERRRSRDEAPSRLDLVRVGTSLSLHRGTELVGEGSAGRFRALTGAFELRVEQFFEGDGIEGDGIDRGDGIDEGDSLGEGFGGGFALAVFPPPRGADDGFVARGELLAGFGVARWEGAVPGSLVLALGAGGDYLDIGSAEPGRVYGLGRSRLTLWLRRDVTMGLAVETLPLVASPVPVSQHEHRFEMSTSHGLLDLGVRATFTFQDGGEPARPFTQQTLGGFIGVMVR